MDEAVEALLDGAIVIPCAVAEVSMVLYLLVKGVKTPQPANRILAAA